MCLIAVALCAHPHFRLVVAANRDEFHDRPSAPASWWDDAPQLFGGRDLQQHGSWFASSRDGRWCAVTNVRRMVPPDPGAPSRGALVTNYLRGTRGARDYLTQLADHAPHYAGFNLLVGDADGVAYASNQPQWQQAQLSAGIHAVSNASLDTPWPKLQRLRQALQQWCAAASADREPLMQALGDESVVADTELPDTGVGLEMERFLATAFIRGPRYGTRCSTVLTVDRQGEAWFQERRFGPGGEFLGETLQRLPWPA